MMMGTLIHAMPCHVDFGPKIVKFSKIKKCWDQNTVIVKLQFCQKNATFAHFPLPGENDPYIRANFF